MTHITIDGNDLSIALYLLGAVITSQAMDYTAGAEWRHVNRAVRMLVIMFWPVFAWLMIWHSIIHQAKAIPPKVRRLFAGRGAPR